MPTQTCRQWTRHSHLTTHTTYCNCQGISVLHHQSSNVFLWQSTIFAGYCDSQLTAVICSSISDIINSFFVQAHVSSLLEMTWEFLVLYLKLDKRHTILISENYDNLRYTLTWRRTGKRERTVKFSLHKSYIEMINSIARVETITH